MRISIPLWLGLFLLPLGCGPGGAGPAPVYSGGWFLQRTDSGTACGDKPELALPVSFRQMDTDLSMTTPETTLAGTVAGTSARIGGPLLLFDTVGMRYVTYSDILLERTGDVITGTAVVRESVSLTGTPVACESVAMLKLVPEMRLISVNLDGVTDAALNAPLVLTFSRDVDLATVTPDTLRITGARGPFFESSTVDGRRLALIPQVANFTDLSDAGLALGTAYVLALTDYLDSRSIQSTQGARLFRTATAMFSTASVPAFVEPRRPLVHLPGPLGMPPGLGDEDGCLNNPGTSLYVAPGFQTGSDATATLLCLVHEGGPRVVPELCTPAHDDREVGGAGLGNGTYNLPAIRIRFNEPVDPRNVPVWDAVTKFGANVQLWRVGTSAGAPILVSASNQVETNIPIAVQRTTETEVILVAQAPVPSGTYLINVRNLTDLPGNPLVTIDRPSPLVGGYAAIDASLSSVIPAGYRFYFRTR